uniref:Uncharacterized protein n=1 Tax=Rhizophora mucronata TaxID=61149 RepID=A0A2P2KW93_RHIMU
MISSFYDVYFMIRYQLSKFRSIFGGYNVICGTMDCQNPVNKSIKTTVTTKKIKRNSCHIPEEETRKKFTRYMQDCIRLSWNLHSLWISKQAARVSVVKRSIKLFSVTRYSNFPFLFITLMYPSCLILCKKSLPKRPSIPLSKLKRPEIFTTIGTSLYLEAYKSPTFPPLL